MKASKGLLHAIALAEGVHKEPYVDIAGHRTVGVGHVILKKDRNLELVLGKPVPDDFKLSEKQIYELLELDLGQYISAVNKYVDLDKISQRHFDALVMFTFNVGVGALRRSTLLKRVNAGRFDDAQNELMRWTKARVRGVLQPVQGLVNRREMERKIFCNPHKREEFHPAHNFRLNDMRFITEVVKAYERGSSL